MQACYRQLGGQVQVVLQGAKVGGEQELDRHALEMVVGHMEGVAPVGIQVRAQNGFVNLDPFDALGLQGAQQLGIDWQQSFQ